MKQFFLKFQLLFEAVILLATLTLVYMVIQPFHERWDLTREKVYSLPRATTGVLRDLKDRRIDLLLFYQQDDLSKKGLEVFLKECQRHHPEFHYDFYDPNRRPQLARKFNVTDVKTVIFRSGGHEERLVAPTEEDFTNAFLRLLHPKDLDVCFVTGHGEVPLAEEGTGGYSRFQKTLQGYNAKIHSIVLTRDHVPDVCQVVVVGGPRWDLTAEEFSDLDKAFQKGKGVFLLVDPMDPGAGAAFVEFARRYGVALGQNVIVDKMSRMVGGDFLMPLVSQYLETHPTGKNMKQATFFPLVRTVQPSVDTVEGLEVAPLALTGDGSWAETDLQALEDGNSTFDIKTDIAGPLPVAVAIQQTTDIRPQTTDKTRTQVPSPEERVPPQGRMIIVGDGDFLTNGYLDISGNKEFGLNMIRWLANDDRFMDVRRPELRFKPLLLDVPRRTQLIVILLGVYPLTFFILGGIYLIVRIRTS
ncbi:MAG TPA: Gldg family protein [Candidatus Omnitrophota bacterium]|nr:Gldg family protein [Candidatus Omnitrophota bacterium]